MTIRGEFPHQPGGHNHSFIRRPPHECPDDCPRKGKIDPFVAEINRRIDEGTFKLVPLEQFRVMDMGELVKPEVWVNTVLDGLLIRGTKDKDKDKETDMTQSNRKIPTAKEMFDAKHEAAKKGFIHTGLDQDDQAKLMEANMTKLVERELFSIHFSATEWWLQDEYVTNYNNPAGGMVKTGKQLLKSGHTNYSRRITVVGDTIDEALVQLNLFGDANGPSLEINGDLVRKPKFENFKVERITRKGRHWVPVDLTGAVQIYRGYYSFEGVTDHGCRDNGKVAVVAKDFESAKTIIEDYAAQEEDVVIHSISYDGEAFVSDSKAFVSDSKAFVGGK